MADEFTLEDVKNIDVESLSKTTPVDSAPGEPPKRRRGRPKGSTNKSKLLPVAEIRDGVTQFVSLIGLGIGVVDTYDASVVIKQAGPLADAVASMAEKDPKIHAQLTKLLRAGSYAALATAGLPIALAVGANHGVLPETFLMDTGVEPTLYGRARTQTEESSNISDNGGGLTGNAFDTIMNQPIPTD